jgi:uncharacterized protein
VFFFVFLSIWTAMNVYVVWRVGTLPLLARHGAAWVLVPVALVLATSYIASRLVERVGLAVLGRPLELLGGVWLIVCFLAVVSLLLADVMTGFGFLLPRLATTFRTWALVATLLLSAVALVHGLRAPVVNEHEVRLNGLPAGLDGTVVVLVSDLHLGRVLGRDWLAARVAQVQALHPDLVVMAGDQFEGVGAGDAGLQDTLRGLSAPLGVWAVTGNHDYFAGVERSVRTLEGAGIHVLRDRWVQVRPGLVLAGVDDLGVRSRPAHGGPNPVDAALAGRPAGVATIYLSHTPVEAARAAAAGVGLMLCGHTHGGQVWPFGYIVRRVYPLFIGRYAVGPMSVIVCRGTGVFGPPMRLWEPSEIVRITLRAPAR